MFCCHHFCFAWGRNAFPCYFHFYRVSESVTLNLRVILSSFSLFLNSLSLWCSRGNAHTHTHTPTHSHLIPHTHTRAHDTARCILIPSVLLKSGISHYLPCDDGEECLKTNYHLCVSPSLWTISRVECLWQANCSVDFILIIKRWMWKAKHREGRVIL